MTWTDSGASGELLGPMDIEPSREVRLGLVMVGGVSLAVYINGVSHELFRAVRGRGVYGLIKRLTRSKVVVDVVSGSSAGGINGILLAYALCNEVEFGTSAGLWREHGDIDQLLRKTDAPPESFRSLLDSESYYQSKLEEAFQTMDGRPAALAAQESGETEVGSTIDELDLFVTGTDFHGRVSEAVDQQGQRISVKDHRVVFWLKHRRGRKIPFASAEVGEPERDPPVKPSPQTHQALATLARITSCFPGAFRPVTVSAAREGVDARLRRWGRITEPEPRILIDGGVLDNKPFTSTIRAIYHRTANLEVNRHLLFIEPDPERFPTEKPAFREPTILETAIAALSQLPSYESIADDLRALEEHNERIRRLDAVADTRRLDSDRAPAPDAASERVYRSARLTGLCEGLFVSLFQNTSGSSKQIVDKHAMRGWFNENVLEDPAVSGEVLDRFDVEFRLRRLFHLSYVLDSKKGYGDQASRQALAFVNAQIQTLEVIRAGMVSAVERLQLQAAEPERAWAEIQETLNRLLRTSFEAYAAATLDSLDAETLLGDPVRKRLHGDLQRNAQSALAESSLLVRSDRFERPILERLASSMREDLRRQLLREYDRFPERDRLIYPLQLLSGVNERDLIRTTRISPKDAGQYLFDRPIRQKLAGLQLGHFGAFFKRSWRSNDILWGRLDAAAQLVSVLLDEGRIRDLVDAGSGCFRVENLETFLPNLPSEQVTRLSQLFRSISDADATQRNQRLTGALPEIKKLLIQAAQLEILQIELPCVIRDAAYEQFAWNHFRVAPPSAGSRDSTHTEPKDRVSIDPAALAFRVGKGPFDPAILTLASVALAEASIRGHKQSLSKFLPYYRVGEETLDQIPRVVLLDLVARALLVVRNCLFHGLGRRGERIRATMAYKLFLDYPLRALALLARCLRDAPAVVGAFMIGSVLYAAVSVIALLKLGVFEGGLERRIWGVLLFVLAPLLLLSISAMVGTAAGPGVRPNRLLLSLLTTIRLAFTGLVVIVLLGLWRLPEEAICAVVLQTVQETAADSALRSAAGLEPKGTCGSEVIVGSIWLGKVLILIMAVLSGSSAVLPRFRAGFVRIFGAAPR